MPCGECKWWRDWFTAPNRNGMCEWGPLPDSVDPEEISMVMGAMQGVDCQQFTPRQEEK